MYSLNSKYINLAKYSKCLKSERLDFGIFQNGSIPKRFGFRTVSEIRTILFEFQMFGLVVSFVRFIFFH